MSDNKTKAEKLAEGKKKLKKFQSKHKKPKEEDDKGSIEQLSTTSENGAEAGAEEAAEVPAETFPPASSVFQSAEVSVLDNLGQIVMHEEGQVKNLTIPEAHERRRTPPHHESLKDELFSLLQNEKTHCEVLEERLKEQCGEIEELRRELQSIRADSGDVAHLREQLQGHMQTLGILVGEKAELTATLTTMQAAVRERNQEVEELQAKLSASRHQVQDMRVEMAQMRESLGKFEHTQQHLCAENETARERIQHLTGKCEDLTEELGEMKQKLLVKGKECTALTEELRKRDSDLALAQLRVEQLSAGDTHAADAKIEGAAQQRGVLEHQVRELLTQLEKMTQERDQAATQYQNYVTQLNRETTSLAQKLQETVQERDLLAKREDELMRHMGELERQLQAQIAQPKGQQNPPQEQVREDDGAVKKLQENLRELLKENEILKKSLSAAEASSLKLQTVLEEKMSQMGEMEMKVERLEASYVDPSSLSATLESEKVAAARAVAQNVELKAQLEEMQRAYVQMTHDKAELMDKLQSEQHLGREMRGKVDGWEVEVVGLREKLHFKDEEMMRLSHENSELEKRTLLQSQELDRLRHCEMGQQTSSVLQIEIQRQKEEISLLQGIIRKLEEGAKESPDNEDVSGEDKTPQEGKEAIEEADVHPAQEVTENGIKENILPTEEAMLRLEERFRRTMDDIAELTEEKQRLEHLVTQLQGETETIGEYVTLYQTQRQILKQREIEKDVQVQRIAADREEMKQKLIELNGLVELLLRQKNIDIPTVPMEVNGDAQEVPEHLSGTPKEENNQQSADLSHSGETAEKILNLLTEIKTNNLNTSNLVVPSGVVHHCSCCSGKLITV
uniref:Golgin subfamily A conserved domain-containing protein n=1 Tax=Lutzomyia longipalpis TaxID=7200 RepID=A0A1B0CKM3_LUTLO